MFEQTLTRECRTIFNAPSIRFIISRMASGDVPEVAEIERTHQREPWSESAFREELQKLHAECFVARAVPGSDAILEADIRVPTGLAGYICMWIVADEVQILNLTVARPFWRRGVGRDLVLRALDAGWSRGCARATLEVRPSNMAARKLYESLGFRLVGERPGFYAEGKETGMIMELDRLW